MVLRMLWIFILPAAFSSDFYLEPQQVMRQLGDRLVLKCGAKNCDKPRFSWRALEDQPLMHATETNTSPTESQLVIQSVNFEHKTKIECAVYCSDRMVFSDATQVKVYSFPADPVVSGNDHLWHGEKSELTCVVRDVYPVELLKIEFVQGETVLKESVGDGYSLHDATKTHASIYSYIPKFGDRKKSITCRATLELAGVPADQQTRQTTVHLSVQLPPENTTVTVYPSWQVQEGQNVTISCRTVSFPPARFILMRDGSSKELVSEDGTFWIPQVTLQDSGRYQLNVSNQLGYYTEWLTLSVMAPPRNTTVTVYPSRRVQEGQNVTISCRTVSFPPARFILTRDGSGKELVSEDGTFWIPQVTLQDSGRYQLNVSNQLGYYTEWLTLSVMAPPQNTTVTVYPSWQVQEGQNVTISCRTVSFPPARFILMRDGSSKELVSEDGTFWIPQVTLQDSGRYQLNISNQLGYHTEGLTLSVMAPPRNTTVTVYPSRQVQEGQNVTISCRTVSFPPARFILTRDGSGKELVSEDGTFWIPQVTLQDSGRYQLNVSNQLGYYTEWLTLSVMAPPQNTTVTVYPSWQVQEGQNVTISCRTVSFPPARFILTRDGNGKELVSEDGTFWIPQVTLQDSGRYQLNVSNQLGNHTEWLMLNVMEQYRSPATNTILPLVITPTVCAGGIVITAAVVMRFLKKANTREAYELAKGTLPTV